MSAEFGRHDEQDRLIGAKQLLCRGDAQRGRTHERKIVWKFDTQPRVDVIHFRSAALCVGGERLTSRPSILARGSRRVRKQGFTRRPLVGKVLSPANQGFQILRPAGCDAARRCARDRRAGGPCDGILKRRKDL